MPAVIVLRTHERGQRVDLKRVVPIPGPVELETSFVAELNRQVPQLRVRRGHSLGGVPNADAIPPLYDPHVLAFNSEQGLVVSGFEQIDGCRYYQGWYIRWVK